MTMITNVPTERQKTGLQGLNVQALLGALQVLEAKATSTPNHPVLAEMTLAELGAALQQMNIVDVPPIAELSQIHGPVNAEMCEAVNARKAEELAAEEKRSRSNARRQAIEDAFQNHAGILLERRPLNSSPTISGVDDLSDLSYADLSSFAPSEADVTETTESVVVKTTENSVANEAEGSAEVFAPKVILKPDGGVKAIICGNANCRAYNPVDTASANGGGGQSWYAVIKGKSVGVFYGWDVVGPLVTGVSRANYTKNTEEKVREIYERALLAGTVKVRPF